MVPYWANWMRKRGRRNNLSNPTGDERERGKRSCDLIFNDGTSFLAVLEETDREIFGLFDKDQFIQFTSFNVFVGVHGCNYVLSIPDDHAAAQGPLHRRQDCHVDALRERFD